MRLKAYKERTQENKTKPHLPLLNEEKKLIMEQEYKEAKNNLMRL